MTSHLEAIKVEYPPDGQMLSPLLRQLKLKIAVFAVCREEPLKVRIIELVRIIALITSFSKR